MAVNSPRGTSEVSWVEGEGCEEGKVKYVYGHTNTPAAPTVHSKPNGEVRYVLRGGNS